MQMIGQARLRKDELLDSACDVTILERSGLKQRRGILAQVQDGIWPF
jgi:hypothetical protein